MMDKVFNTAFENALRILILLDEYDMPKTLDMLYVVDFMALYSALFGVTDKNLNGDNEYKYNVFASHRESIKEALRELVLSGVVQAVGYNGGLSYIITPEGEYYCKSLNSDYAKEYRKNVKAIVEHIGNKSERSLIAEIYKLSAMSFRWRAEQ